MTSIKLKIGDSQDIVEVPLKAAKMSTTLKNMLEDLGETSSDASIPVHNVTILVFTKIMEFCKQHMDEQPKEEKKTVFRRQEDPWDVTWVEALEQKMLFDIMLASNYLDIKPLLDLCCSCVAKQFKKLTPEEIRKRFNITAEFSPEEEEKVKAEVIETFKQRKN